MSLDRLRAGRRNLVPQAETAMHIEHEVKLDFKDVLIRPKRSTLTSRSEVDITREFAFRQRACVSGHSDHRLEHGCDRNDRTCHGLAALDLSDSAAQHHSIDVLAGFFSRSRT